LVAGRNVSLEIYVLKKKKSKENFEIQKSKASKLVIAHYPWIKRMREENSYLHYSITQISQRIQLRLMHLNGCIERFGTISRKPDY
jgi:hypothetical protein